MSVRPRGHPGTRPLREVIDRALDKPPESRDVYMGALIELIAGGTPTPDQKKRAAALLAGRATGEEERDE